MGGLVIKKAYILAQQFQEFESIAERVRAIFFLATPHRGSDLAALLTRILHVAHGARPFVQDLHRNSLATQSINDEFSHHCQKLQLFSFYETLPINYIIGKGLVVDKDLAVLGYSNERTAYMHANHRDICKYADKKDPNYHTVRNALASVVDSLRSRTSLTQHDTAQLSLLSTALDMSDAVEDDLIGIDSRRVNGSCEWLMEKKSFQRWRDCSSEAKIYWVSAKPASGKTVLSGFIIKHLRELDEDCGFYFFDSGNKAKTTISSWLRSMAWQMAVKHSEVLTTVLEVYRKDDQLAKADYRTIWRKLFLDGIMKVKLNRPQYWVVDALDECQSDVELVPLLLKCSEMLNVRFFVTSRSRYETYGRTISTKTTVISEEISADDTKSDIAKYLNENIEFLPAVNEGGHQSTIIKIVEKSAGCFLWVKLILEELRHVHTSAEVHQVLEEVPSDMDELYTRILNSMSKAPYGKALAKAILTWTVCSARPLTTEELYYALQLDIKDSIDRIEKSITASCGQLVYIDSRSCVHMVHQTARDFLLQSSIDSEFRIDKKAGHKRLLITCLQYLCGNEMKGPRHRKLSVQNTLRPRCAFSAYACSALHEHIRFVSSTDDDLFFELIKFLNSSNILSWIEHLAQVPDLTCIIQTGRSLRKYLQRRSRSVSPIGKDIATMDSWSTDLVRLVAKFGKTMSASPASIFHLIPPFCPPESAPRKQFAASTRGITVVGLSATSWDDCLSTIVRPSEQLTAVACCDTYFAVGSSNGRFAVYNEMTCQEIQELHHSEPVRMLQFGQSGSVVASSGMKIIRLWDVDSWQQLWQQDLPRDCLSLCFIDEDRLLLGALRNNQLMIWDCASGLLTDCADWTENDDGQRNHAYRRPISAAICVETSLLAVVYRGQDILIWDIESNAPYDTYAKGIGSTRNSTTISTTKAFVTGGLVFSADPSATLLAASYSDGDLVLFETTEGIVKEKTLANAQILASSPNGRTLAAADSTGRIQIFDFETLRLLHCISAGDYNTKALTFSGDNSRLLDIRGSECRVWDPTALLRPDEVDDNSDTVSVFTLPLETMVEPSDDIISISALTCHVNGEVIFCGKSDGGIYLYYSNSGSRAEKLISHASNVPIVSLYYDNQSSVLSSVDSSSRVMLHKVILQEKAWRASGPLFDHRVGVAIDQVLSNKGAAQVLLSSSSKDVLFSITDDGSSTFTSTEIVEQRPHRWENHPLDPDQLVFMSNERIHIYEWKTLRRVTASNSISLEDKMLSQLSIRFLTSCGQGRHFAATFSESSASRHRPKKLLLWNTSDFFVQSESTKLLSSYRVLTDQVRYVIGAYGQKLVFLDSNGWVCSADVGMPNADRYTRHFFIPIDWLSAGANLMIDVTCNGDIVFVKRHEIAVIKRGLESSEQGPSATSARSPIRGAQRPSLASSRSRGSDDMFLKPYPERERPSLPIGKKKVLEDIFP